MRSFNGPTGIEPAHLCRPSIAMRVAYFQRKTFANFGEMWEKPFFVPL